VYTISSHSRCLSVVAWMQWFIITVTIAWNLQTNNFTEEFNLLQRGKHIRRNLKNLGLFLLTKVGSHWEHANVPRTSNLNFKQEHFVDHYMRYIHLKIFHAGPKTLVGLTRLQFWIVNARRVPVLLNQIMGQLPKVRLIPPKPFLRCRVYSEL